MSRIFCIYFHVKLPCLHLNALYKKKNSLVTCKCTSHRLYHYFIMSQNFDFSFQWNNPDWSDITILIKYSTDNSAYPGIDNEDHTYENVQHKLYASKSILSAASPVWKSQLSSKWNNMEVKKLHIDTENQLDADMVYCLLQSIYERCIPARVCENINLLCPFIELANQFQVFNCLSWAVLHLGKFIQKCDVNQFKFIVVWLEPLALHLSISTPTEMRNVLHLISLQFDHLYPLSDHFFSKLVTWLRNCYTFDIESNIKFYKTWINKYEEMPTFQKWTLSNSCLCCAIDILKKIKTQPDKHSNLELQKQVAYSIANLYGYIENSKNYILDLTLEYFIWLMESDQYLIINSENSVFVICFIYLEYKIPDCERTDIVIERILECVRWTQLSPVMLAEIQLKFKHSLKHHHQIIFKCSCQAQQFLGWPMYRIIQYRNYYLKENKQDKFLLLTTLNLLPRKSPLPSASLSNNDKIAAKEIVLNFRYDDIDATEVLQSKEFLHDGFIYQLILCKNDIDYARVRLNVRSAIPIFDSIDPTLILSEKYNSFPPCLIASDIFLRIFNFWSGKYENIKPDVNDGELLLIPIENSTPNISSYKSYDASLFELNWYDLCSSHYVSKTHEGDDDDDDDDNDDNALYVMKFQIVDTNKLFNSSL